FYQLLLAITDVAAVKFSQYHYGENSIFFTIFPNYADFSNTLLGQLDHVKRERRSPTVMPW
ncbi:MULTISPECIES: hypothetical protein, partial [unclassified Synechocystis]|uniref:hypothetical protein n=1 Tax=unclassified Synechocystis TaxID=2640012 RepID=UPI001A7EEAC5